MKTLAIAAAALVAVSTSALAHPDRIDRRQDRQEARIEHGLRTGAITRREARDLEAEQNHIRDLERAAKRDGYIDRHEARRIEEAQDRASRHIRSEARDVERRGWGYGWWRRSEAGNGYWQRRWW